MKKLSEFFVIKNYKTADEQIVVDFTSCGMGDVIVNDAHKLIDYLQKNVKIFKYTSEDVRQMIKFAFNYRAEQLSAQPLTNLDQIVFDLEFRPLNPLLMDFSQALLELKAGKRVQRSGWNGKNMWLVLVRKDNYIITELGVNKGAEILPWIGMKTADNKFVPWIASQTDLLSVDWQIVE